MIGRSVRVAGILRAISLVVVIGLSVVAAGGPRVVGADESDALVGDAGTPEAEDGTPTEPAAPLTSEPTEELPASPEPTDEAEPTTEPSATTEPVEPASPEPLPSEETAEPTEETTATEPAPDASPIAEDAPTVEPAATATATPTETPTTTAAKVSVAAVKLSFTIYVRDLDGKLITDANGGGRFPNSERSARLPGL